MQSNTTINQFLINRGVDVVYGIEGYSQQVQEQVIDLINLTNQQNINIMEIGFNAGHSADIFLKNNNTLTLTSFDLGIHNCVSVAKQYIDLQYPNRHTLILGDSTKTIPEYIANNSDKKFDFIFIDGGHDYSIAKSDLENCFHFATKDTIVAIDDTIFTIDWIHGWNIGPTNTWIEHLQQNKVIELNRKEYSPGRGMCWGKYVVTDAESVYPAL
jgi:predicted O-methyltransferase YrrM